MSEINYRRITDWNCSIYGQDKHTSFEAGFSIAEKVLCLHGRIIDSNGVEVACSGDLRELGLDVHKNWNPMADLEAIINVLALQTTEIEPLYLQNPLGEMTFEIKSPISDIFLTRITMSNNFRLLESYEWQDSSSISVTMFFKRAALLEFTRGLQSDLLMLLSHEAV